MATVTFKGNPVQTVGELPRVGESAPDFTLTTTELTETSLSDYRGKTVVLNIFPSIDTPVCSMSVRKFNAEIAKKDTAVVLCISMDLPFAHSRFCGSEGLDDVVSLSAFRNRAFGDAYGIRIAEGPLNGLFARAVVVIDGAGKVLYTELVPEIAEEPGYDAAMAAVGG
ncbi:MAG: thiol peroxidase [Desulfobacterales bacterium]|jgi:thiol peroxidase